MLNKSANSLFKLLENLLDWARMQQGIITFDPEPFSVSDKINGCQEVATDSARNKEIRIIADIPENLQGYADIRMFETVVRNLVSNAVKFTGKGGTVSISAREPEPGFLEVTISDSGIGMKKEMVDNLFNINIKTGRAGTEGETSTGLGLIICKDFIEKHGGEVFVDSEEGKGSTFRFRLPQKSKLPDLED
jgi:signal transduction histidine kinase